METMINACFMYMFLLSGIFLLTDKPGIFQGFDNHVFELRLPLRIDKARL